MQPATGTDFPAIVHDPAGDTPAELWQRMVEAARRDDQTMANVYFRRWCAAASAIVDQVCDRLLDEHTG